MTGELNPIGPVNSPPEERRSKTPLAPAVDAGKGHPLAPPERVAAVSEPSKIQDRHGHARDGGTLRVEPNREAGPPQVEELAEKFEEHLESLHAQGYLRELRLDYENLEDGGLVVKIMDARTDKVIREIPPEDQIEFAKRMEEVLGLIMDELA